MWCKYIYICKYCICDISTIVNEFFIFTIVLMSHIPYLLTHLINSKCIVNANYYAVCTSATCYKHMIHSVRLWLRQSHIEFSAVAGEGNGVFVTVRGHAPSSSIRWRTGVFQAAKENRRGEFF